MESDYGIKPEWLEAWRGLEKECSKALYGNCSTLGCTKRDASGKFLLPREFIGCADLRNYDLICHLLAGWMRERFEREHREWNHEFRSGCVGCMGKKIDPRHNFQDADWDRVAREGLGGA